MVMGRESTPNPVTLVYKTISTSGAAGQPSEISLHLDVYPPNSHSNDTPASENNGVGVPVVLYFHGGALVVGDRKSWFPEWLHRRLAERGVAFLSPDYRLLSPATGHDTLEDIKDLFAYIRNDLNAALAATTGDLKLRINTDAICVAGSSAGGLCTYLCAMHLSPKPKALLSIYGAIGECLNDYFLEPKTKPFVVDRPLDDPADFTEFLFPQSLSLPVVAESPVEYYPPTHETPGLPATKRMHVSGLYFQLGVWLDYYTGDHTLSQRLRQLELSPVSSSDGLTWTLDPIKAREVIGEKNIRLLPQFGVAWDWPPALFVHGTKDCHVLLHESKHLAEKLRGVGVKNELIEVEGQPHGFDNALDAEKKYRKLFDRAADFLLQNLHK